MGTSYESDPLVSFSFQVSFGNECLARCSSVDGLSKEVEMIEYRDASAPNLPHFRQGRRKAPRITIKKAYLYGGLGKNELFNWIAEADKGTVTPKDVSITVGSYGNVTPDKYESGAQRNFANQNAWVLRNCTPTKWSIGALDGNSNSLILESLALVGAEITVGK